MKAWLIGVTGAAALVAVAAIAQERGSGPFGEGRGWRGHGAQLSSDDRAAFTDARIAALHAGLRLTPDQEKLWPPVEDAMRGLARQRSEAQQARRERFLSMREGGAAQDLPTSLRFMAERQAASADALRKLADAAQPLHASLDEAQKRRLAILTRGLRPGGMAHGGGMRPGGWMRGGELAPGPVDKPQRG